MKLGRRQVLAAGALLAAHSWAPVAAESRQRRDHSRRIKALIAAMTLAEKLGQMTQIPGGRQKALNSKLDSAMLDRVRRGEIGSFLHVAGAAPLKKLQKVAVEESRLGIPLLFAMDVIHGYRTILPVPLALAASWDVQLAEEAARVAAEEAWAAGLHWTFTPMVDVARDPRWGRIVEGAGEDPYLSSRMAEAQVRGFQTDDLGDGVRVMACAKHFVGYGAVAAGRDYDSADLSDRTLHEVYLPPFAAAQRAGVGSMMTAFNDIGGVPMTANEGLVRGLLRQGWGYQGLVVSDWNAVKELVNHGVAATPAEAAALALRAGVDMEMASTEYAEHLGEAVRQDPGLEPLIDQAVERILAAKARLGLFDEPYGFGSRRGDDSPSARHRASARRAAQRSIVLLRNENALLPLAPGKRVALIGALADDDSSPLGSWRGRGDVNDVVTLRKALPDAEFVPGVRPRSDDRSGIPAAVEAAKRADVVLLVVGEDYDYTGEARSYSQIGLPGPQQALIDAVRATGKPIVAILMNGRPLALESALRGIPAVLETWFLGIESGPAIVDVLTGKVSPGGRLPIGFPRTTGQVPMPYAHYPTGRPADPDLKNDTSRYHDVDIGALFPFGHGLGYAPFEYSGLAVTPGTVDAGGSAEVSVTVANMGRVAADEVVQLYIRAPVPGVSRPVKELRGFTRLTLQSGERRRVAFTLDPQQFAYWSPDGWSYPGGTVELMVGTSSEDIRMRANLEVRGGFTSPAPGTPAASIETLVTIA
ncbi:MAG: glycoside hydrolase family 3 C-terminal domain-containing protein [Sphingomonas sp.]|uniref:glycoside hydrolase family 3 N-terminal domain-containing protein n=1 Tax=Sphingomonas sp. TaxID=28214 RepID=UPI001AFD1ED8|nr:glycoside hydrolase family 3 N-terminal domain-containing protein [Sphingomonas sp.]MBO9624410.1 glycoside hydrolase family 3 C-terminal domain-containing protein [Sphingomonas sp.]